MKNNVETKKCCLWILFRPVIAGGKRYILIKECKFLLKITDINSIQTRKEKAMDQVMQEIVETYDVKIKMLEYTVDFITYDLDLVICLN